jgi:hypothetical protein
MNNKRKKRHGLIIIIGLLFISTLALSYIPFKFIPSSSGKSCCNTFSDSDEYRISKITISKSCSCCVGECRCAYKEKPFPDLPFNGISKVQIIPDLSPPGENSCPGYNFSALIFNQVFPDINTTGYGGKVPIYLLKSSMLC